MKKKKNLIKLLNLNFTKYTNQTYLVGKYDLPYVTCSDVVNPDYLALYSETNNYYKTENTCICFYLYDNKFDGIKGIYNAIYYDDEKLLAKYKERFKGVKYAIAPDYSQCGDIPRYENIYRLAKARIVSNWLLLECNVLVIPNVTYANENYFDVMLDGMESTEVVAFSVKGLLRDLSEQELLLKAIKHTVDNLVFLKKIIVYSVSTSEEKIMSLFEYALSKGIEIIIPNNILKERNIINKKVVVSNG